MIVNVSAIVVVVLSRCSYSDDTSTCNILK